MSESTTTATESNLLPNNSSTAGDVVPGTPLLRPPLRLVAPTLVLVLYWVLTEASFRVEMGMFYRFVSRMALLVAMLLYFLGWGFTRRHFTVLQRLLAFVMILTAMFVAGAGGHQSTGVFAAALIGLPIVISLSVAWLWISRHRAPRVELSGIGIVSIVVFGCIALLRWDGLDGRQRTELSWRWTPSPEERFLKQDLVKPAISADDRRPVLRESPADWVSFRGGEKESVVVGVELQDWSATPPREIWRRRVGPGWSSIIAVGDELFTQEQRGDKEAVVCYDAKTGQEIWIHSPSDAGGRFEEKLSGTGPRATPAYHENRIYVFGATGNFECLDVATGELHWSHLLFSMTGASIPQWGSASSPTIVDDLVVVFVGGQHDNSLLAFDRLSGKPRWQSGGGGVSYSSPQVMTIAGERQIVMHDNEGLNGIQIQDGKRLWKHAGPPAVGFEPMIQPHLIPQDRLIINWDSGLLCLQVRRVSETWKTDEVWKSTRMKPSFNDFAIHGDQIYGLDDGIFCCVDLSNGQRKWKRGRYGFGQLLMLQDLNEILVLTERGEIVRVAIDPNEHRELGRFKAIEGKTWNHPLLAHGRLIVRNGEEIACFAVEEK